MKQGHRSNHRRRKPRNIVLTAFCVALAAILIGMGIYVAQWYLNLGRIRAEGERYARMYSGRDNAPAPSASREQKEQHKACQGYMSDFQLHLSSAPN